MAMNARKLRLRGSVARHGEALEQLRSPGDAVLVERGLLRGIVLSCPCGCGESLPINLDSRAGPAWRLYGDPSKGITLFPSVWRESGCRSHFIVWRGRIYGVGRPSHGFDRTKLSSDVERALVTSVRDALPENSLLPFSDIAEKLAAIPWDVLLICRHLVRVGAAREGKGGELGSFGRPNH